MRTRALGLCLLAIALSLLSASLLSAEEGAAAAAPETQGVCVNAKGTCYLYDDRQLEAWVTIGSDQGLRPGARVEFARKGEVVAQGEVVTIRAIDCVVRPAAGTPAGTIMRGDDVRVTLNGTEGSRKAQLNRERNFNVFESLFFSGVFAYCIML